MAKIKDLKKVLSADEFAKLKTNADTINREAHGVDYNYYEAVKNKELKCHSICGLFTWHMSPEGHDYWDEINNKVNKLIDDNVLL